MTYDFAALVASLTAIQSSAPTSHTPEDARPPALACPPVRSGL